MANVVIKFTVRTTRCEGASLRTYEPGEELVLPRRLGENYVGRNRAEIVRECQAHVIPPEAKIDVADNDPEI